jgi:hypothetical protein
MPVETTCPNCRRAVRITDELLGQRVQCPLCESVFVAEVEHHRPAPASEQSPTMLPAGPDAAEQVWPTTPVGHYLRPHRGGLILGLGIAGLVSQMMSCLICPPVGMLIGLSLGVPAWAMGQADYAAMRAGVMDREGESNTQAGRICGIIATALAVVGCLGYVGVMGIFGLRGGRFRF